MSEPAGQPRRAELSAALTRIRERLDRAAGAAGRSGCDLRLVAVTKTFPAADAALLAGLGQADLGESREQELRPKVAELAGTGVRWHFLGRLQRNKARAVGRLAEVVHSVDRVELLGPLAAGAEQAGRPVQVFVQVTLDQAAGRGGVDPDRLPSLADRVAATDGLELVGVMAVAPLGAEPERAFGRLAQLAADLRAAHPAAGRISAGMSGDLEQAVAAGATDVRVGRALLGERPPLLR